MNTQVHKPARRADLHLALVAVAGCLLSAVALSTARAAAPVVEVPQVVVKYGDLNLATDEGNRALHHRIVAAARQVCPEEDFGRILSKTVLARQCQQAAVARAIDAVRSAQVATMGAKGTPRG